MMSNSSHKNRSPFFAVISIVLLFGLGSISPLSAYEIAPVEQGGELFGTIRYDGKPPSRSGFQVSNDQDYCGSIVENESFQVNPENYALQNAVVSIENIKKGKKPLNSTVVIKSRNCRFVPHVQAAMEGDSYELRNADIVLHIAHLHLGETTLFNVAMPPNGSNIRKPLLQAGIISIKCDAHTFMQGWLVVFNNPYFAVSDQDGKFSITDIPAGKYRVTIWHEGLPVKEKEVTISQDKKTILSMDMTTDGK